MMGINEEWDSATPVDDEWEYATPVSEEEWESAIPIQSSGKAESGIGTSLKKRASNIANEWSAPPDEDILGSFAKSSGRTFRTLGQIAGGVNDIIGAGIVAGAKGLYATLPEDVQEGFESAMSGVGTAIAPTVKTLSEAYGRGKKAYPEMFGNLEAAGNIIGLVPSSYLGTKTAKVADSALDVVKGAMTPARTAEYFDKAIDEAVEYGFKKGIKPTVVGKSNAEMTEKFYDNAKTATKEIAERYPDSLPKNTEDFSKVVRQAKRDIWEESSTMASEAGEKGAMVSIKPIRDDLSAIIEAENVPQSAKRAAKIVLNEIKSYADEVAPTVAEDLIANFNSRTKGFWKKPDWNKTDAPLQFERTAKMLRESTDNAVNAYEGPGWQDLRKRYGAQSAIEKAVTDRANVAARANVKGFFDLTDVFTTGEFISALVTHNPASLARAAAMYSAKKYAKSQNNVDRIVKKMFEKVGDLSSQKPRTAPGGYTPKVGPFVKSSDVDDMITSDLRVRKDIEADALQGQYGEMGIPERPPTRSPLERSLNPADDYLATEGGAIDTAYRISPQELEAMRAADMMEGAGVSNLDLPPRPFTSEAERMARSQRAITGDEPIPFMKRGKIPEITGDQPPYFGKIPKSIITPGMTKEEMRERIRISIKSIIGDEPPADVVNKYLAEIVGDVIGNPPMTARQARKPFRNVR